jgi:hypothetical protein
MPACPPDGCTCAWLWVPRGCGQPNMYMQGYKCMVTGATSTTPLAKAQPPVMCDLDPSKCVVGAKQMIVWNQLTGNNVVTTGSQTPAYNLRNGFKPGAQLDIFQGPASSASSSSASSLSGTASISISATPSAPTLVQSPSWTTSALGSPSSSTTSSATTLATVVKPASTTSTSIATSESVVSLPGEQWSQTMSTVSTTSANDAAENVVTVTATVTVTAGGSVHTGVTGTKHFRECWVEYDEELDG